MAKGNRGGKRSSGSISNSNKIKNEMLQAGLNSKFKGVQRDAQNGTGVYTFKDAQAVSSNEALKMNILSIYDKNGNTLVEGLSGNKHVFYASSSSDATITKLKQKQSNAKSKQVADMKSQVRPDITTTTTYNRWKKQHDKNFKAWFYGKGGN